MVECSKTSGGNEGLANDLIAEPYPKKMKHDEVEGESKVDPTEKMIQLLGEHMPSDASSPAANYLSGFMMLRLMLLRKTRSSAEEDMVRILTGSYTSYCSAGRTRGDIALLLARDCMFLSQPPQNSSSIPFALSESQEQNGVSNEGQNNVANNNGFIFNDNGRYERQRQAFESDPLEVSDHSAANRAIMRGSSLMNSSGTGECLNLNRNKGSD